mmetsp:Transcript_7095/g.43900  ORF Transcript_7095/g.43900 Transcript_7095/m.43900 type:complete len:120 (-) Transcript_7095:2391-2750(-)
MDALVLRISLELSRILQSGSNQILPVRLHILSDLFPMTSTPSNALFIDRIVFSNGKLPFRPPIGHNQQFKHTISTDIQVHGICISKVQPCLKWNEKVQHARRNRGFVPFPTPKRTPYLS